SAPGGHGLALPRPHAGRRLRHPRLPRHRLRGDRPVSVRRLAKDQPASFAFSPENLEKAKWWMGKFPPGRQQSAVIALLWIVQKQEGWVPEPGIRAVAELIGMPVIRVLECATFYTMFQLEPVGRVAHVQVCGTPPCALCGADELMAVLKTEI